MTKTQEVDELTKQYIRDNYLADPETGKIFSLKTNRVVGSYARGYERIHILKKDYKSHRICWFLYYDNFPKTQIDHINGIKNDNRKINLREATPSQNNQNTTIGIKNKSGYKGVNKRVSIIKKPYRAEISYNGNKKHLGYFHTKEEAHTAYVEASLKYHGEFSPYARKTS